MGDSRLAKGAEEFVAIALLFAFALHPVGEFDELA